MRRGITAGVFLATALPALAQTDLEKRCILAAAEKLPRIPGIEITEAKIIPRPPELAKVADPSLNIVFVNITFRAAGQSDTYKFLCGKAVKVDALIVNRYSD